MEVEGLRTFTGQAVRGDPRQGLSADVTEGGPGVGAGVPVVHPWEMFHIKLGRLVVRREGQRTGGRQESGHKKKGKKR